MNSVAEQASKLASPASAAADPLASMDQLASIANTQSAGAVDAPQFHAALERYMSNNARTAENIGASGVDVSAASGSGARSGQSLGDQIIGRATHLASELKADQQYVSKTLEQATRNGDPAQLMKAMMALNEYQLRVQFVSKSVSKAASGIDQLTRLQ